MARRYVMDACALIALFESEEGADIVEQLLNDSARRVAEIRMHKINLLEIYYGDYRAHGKEAAQAMIKLVQSMPIAIIPELTDRVFKEAGRLKATYKISLADAIVLAEAAVSDSAVITADHHELDIVQQIERIAFEWIR